jgi:NAD(P)H-dependent flavin oxidoreductase YrpB (nitropropane dioxygenase family)
MITTRFTELVGCTVPIQQAGMVLAAGGIGTGRAMATALAAGADGVRVGTRFVAAAEAAVHPEYVAALIGAEAQDTAYTEAFSVGWPTRPTAFCARPSRQPKP